VDECFERVQGILSENFDKVEEITAILLEKEVLEGSEFNKLLGFPEKEEAPENGDKKEGETEGESQKEENNDDSARNDEDPGKM
jgi:hypothetical protein